MQAYTRTVAAVARINEYFIGEPGEYTRTDLAWFYGFIAFSLLISTLTVLY